MTMLIVGESVGGNNLWKCVKCGVTLRSFSTPNHTCKPVATTLTGLPAELPFGWDLTVVGTIAYNAYRKVIGEPEQTWGEMSEDHRVLFANVAAAVINIMSEAQVACGLATLVNTALVSRYWDVCADVSEEKKALTRVAILQAVSKLNVNLSAVKELSEQYGF